MIGELDILILRMHQRIDLVVLVSWMHPIRLLNSMRNREFGDHCHVFILKYLSKLPESAKDLNVFYFRPLSKVPDKEAPWFSSVPVGKNILSTMVKKMCKMPKLKGKKLTIL